jgi:CHASE2 domain-containing sensor protein
MAEPFIHVGTYMIQRGKTEEARKRIAELVDFVETNEPRMIAFNVYFDEEGSKLTVVQVHPDSASMEFHFAGQRQALYDRFRLSRVDDE